MRSINNIVKIMSSGIGIAGGIIGMISYKGDYGIVGISALLIIISVGLISSVYNLIKNQTSSVIGNIAIPRYSIRAAKREDLAEVANLQQSCYPNDAVPYTLYIEWFDTNPDGFFIVQLTTTDSSGIESKEIVGHFTFLAIKESCMEIYRQGDMLETGIRKAHLHSPEEKSLMDSIYVESVIIKKKHRRHANFCLLRTLDSMITHFCGVKKKIGPHKIPKHEFSVKKVYAMAATNDGAKTLKGMGFAGIVLANNKVRQDHHEMYECDFDHFLDLIRAREEMYEINMLK